MDVKSAENTRTSVATGGIDMGETKEELQEEDITLKKINQLVYTQHLPTAIFFDLYHNYQ